MMSDTVYQSALKDYLQCHCVYDDDAFIVWLDEQKQAGRYWGA